MILKDYNSNINFFCVMCTIGVPAILVPVVYSSFERLSDFYITYPSKFSCPCGIGKITDFSGLCPAAPANTYQPLEGGILAIACPLNANSLPGSDSLDDCKCNAGFSPDPVFDANGVQINFNCYCDPGYYENGAACVKCQTCDPGWYRSGCQRNSAGVCVQCSCPVFWMVLQSKPSG